MTTTGLQLGGAVAGGLLIAGAAATFFRLHGRILGVSGITFGLLRPKRGDVAWRLAFVLGLVCAGLVARVVVPEETRFVIDTPPALLIAGGLLVGFGTRMANGCTSGHGICGVARFSPRSLVATLCFIGAGIATALVAKHLGGW